MRKIKLFLASLIISLTCVSVFPTSAHAQAANTASEIGRMFQKKYNDAFTHALISEFSDNMFIGWNNGGIIKVIFTICFLFALMNVFSKLNQASFLKEMVSLALWTWLILALIGGPTYTKLGFLQINDENYSSNSKSLDVDIFNFFAYHADGIAAQFIDASTSTLIDSSLKQRRLSQNMMNARLICSTGKEGIPCFNQFLVDDKDINPEDVKASLSGTGAIDSNVESSTFVPTWVLVAISTLKIMLSDLTLLAFYIVNGLMDLVRAVLNVFILASFGIVTGFSFFLSKFFLPFAIYPKWRGKVLAMLKIPLSAALYGLATSLVVYVSAAAFGALNYASTAVIVGTFKNPAGATALAEATLLFSISQINLTAGMVIIMLIQFVAMFKIPKLCKDILNLSMESIVGFAQEAAMLGGKVLSMAVPVAGAALGAGLGAMAANVVSKGKGGIGAIKSKFGMKNANITASKAEVKSPKGGGPTTGGGGGDILSPKPSYANLGTSQTSVQIAEKVSGDSALSQPSSSSNENISQTKEKGKLTLDEKLKKIGERKQIRSGMFGNLLSAGMAAGVGRGDLGSKIMEGAVEGAAHGFVESAESYVEKKTDPEAYKARKAAYEEAQSQGLMEQKRSSFSEAFRQKTRQIESEKNARSVALATSGEKAPVESGSDKADTTAPAQASASSMISKTDESALQIDEMLSKIKSGEEVSNDDLIRSRVNQKMSSDQGNKIDREIIERAKESMSRVKSGNGTEEDMDLIYRVSNISQITNKKGKAEKKFNFNRESLIKNDKKLNEYFAKKNAENEAQMQLMKKEKVDSRTGYDAYESMKANVEAGYMKRDILNKEIVSQIKEKEDAKMEKVKSEITEQMKAVEEVESKNNELANIKFIDSEGDDSVLIMRDSTPFVYKNGVVSNSEGSVQEAIDHIEEKLKEYENLAQKGNISEKRLAKFTAEKDYYLSILEALRKK